MTDTSTAGWYPDPEGRPALERWWNGLGWSESVRAVPGSGAILTAQDLPATDYQDPRLESHGFPDEFTDVPVPNVIGSAASTSMEQTSSAGTAAGSVPRPVRSWSAGVWAGWIGGAAALALIIGLVVAVGGSTDPAPPAGTAALPSDPTRSPGQTRIIDEAAGVAYPFLGPYWLEYVGEVTETTSTAGEYIVTQDVVPSGGQFIAQVTSGPLQALFGYAGPASFADTIAEVQDSVRTRYYPLPNTIETLRDEPITIDSAPAYLLEFNLSWDVAGYDSTGERAALILIETGRSAPALVYISIPNTHAELYGIVDRVIGSIEVLN